MRIFIDKIRGIWNPINRIIAYGVIFSSLRMLVGAISAVYLIAVGLRIQDVAYIKAFQALVIFVLDIPLAYIADKKSRKLSVVLSVFFAALWLFTMGVGYKKYHFFIGEFFNAVSLALLSGAYISYLIDKGKEYSSDACSIKQLLGKYHKFQFMGMGVAALIGSAFVTVSSRLIWIIAGLLVSFQFLILSWMLPKDVQFERVEEKLSAYGEIFGIFKDIVRRIEIKWFAFSLFLVMVYYQVIIQFWQLIIQQADKSVSKYGIYYGITFTLILFAQSVSGYLAEKLSEEFNTVIVLIFGLVSLIFLDMPYDYAVYFIPASIILMFFSIRLMTIVLQSKVHEKIEARLRSTYDSVISTVVRLFLLLFIPAVGIAFNAHGKVIFSILFFVALSVYVYMLRFKRIFELSG